MCSEVGARTWLVWFNSTPCVYCWICLVLTVQFTCDINIVQTECSAQPAHSCVLTYSTTFHLSTSVDVMLLLNSSQLAV